MKKSLLKIICFSGILVSVLIYMNSVFMFKYGDGIYGLKKFYEQDSDTVDLLILGSSHAFESFNTGILWDEFGISSFVLAGSEQPMWNTYYYLKEALKTQKPKLVIVEGFGTFLNYEYSDDSRIVKNNYGLKWSEDKIESLKVSTPEERWIEFFPEYCRYHNRYKEIGREDFLKDQGKPLYRNWKGFGCNMDTESFESEDVCDITEAGELTEKTEKYYRAVLELLKSEGIQAMVVVAPYAGISQWHQRVYNRAGEIADEFDIPFINGNVLLKEMGIDYSTDAGDISHLNYRGNQKFTRYIGNIINDDYDLKDHRKDERYISWQADADYINRTIKNQELRECSKTDEFIDRLKNNDYQVFMSANDTEDEFIRQCIEELGGDISLSGGICMKDGMKNLWNSGDFAAEYYYDAGSHDFCLKRAYNEEKGAFENSIIMDRTDYSKVEDGLNIVVYDRVTEELVDSAGIRAGEGSSIER